MGGGFLDVAEWDAGVECCGDEPVAKGVWSDALVDAGPAGDPSHDPRCRVAVQPGAAGGEEDRSVEPSPMARSTARAVRGAIGTVTVLPPLPTMVTVR